MPSRELPTALLAAFPAAVRSSRSMGILSAELKQRRQASRLKSQSTDASETRTKVSSVASPMEMMSNFVECFAISGLLFLFSNQILDRALLAAPFARGSGQRLGDNLFLQIRGAFFRCGAVLRNFRNSLAIP